MRPCATLWLVAALGCNGADDTDTMSTTTSTSGNVHDPLSMPESPTVDPAMFTSATVCRECHPDQYGEWRTSMHAYAMVDPVFQALTELRQQDLDGTEDQFCTSCHSAIGTRGGEVVAGFSFDDLSDITMEGITCEACHKVSSVARDYNSGHVLDAEGPMRGPGGTTTDSPAHAIASDPLFESSEFCGACHDVIETSGLDLERPYREWLESPSAEAGTTCQDCHMPEVERAPAVDVGPRTVRQHRFVGVDVPLIDGWITPEETEALRADIQGLLTGSADVQLEAPSQITVGQIVDVNVTIENLIPAHNLPTGSTFLRQVWLELVATDDQGEVLYVTGDLDANGDLRDHWSELDPYGDHDLVSLSSNFVDQRGDPTLFSWIATEHTSAALSPLYDRTYTLFVPTEASLGDRITVEARLRFRALPPHLLRLLGLGDAVSQLDIYDIDAASIDVELLSGE